tara:strand:- start:2407 stop:2601 length:195 start_codon:yes stop_codon:yes gene_type:complete
MAMGRQGLGFMIVKSNQECICDGFLVDKYAVTASGLCSSLNEHNSLMTIGRVWPMRIDRDDYRE